MTDERSHLGQVILSLIGAVVLIAITIAIVTLNLGRGLDPEEIELRQEQREEQREEREEREEERQDRLDDQRDD